MPSLTRSLSLDRKLPLLILALLGVVIVTSLGISYYEVRRTAELSTADRLAGISEVLASLIDQATQTRLVQMRRVARDTAVAAALAAPRQPASRRGRTRRSARSRHARRHGDAGRAVDPRRPLVGAHGLETAVRRAARARRAGAVGRRPATRGTHDPARLAWRPRVDWDAVPVRAPRGTLLGYLVQERRININPQDDVSHPSRRSSAPDMGFYFPQR